MLRQFGAAHTTDVHENELKSFNRFVSRRVPSDVGCVELKLGAVFEFDHDDVVNLEELDR